jgi:ribose 5-phosphate isomerase A
MDAKRIAAEKAVEYVKEGKIVGLGTGTTSVWAIKALGEKVKGGLGVQAVASSVASEDLAKECGILIVPFSEIQAIDLTIDGADEVDQHLHLVKGGGGALLREKILAYNTKEFIVIVDESKLVTTLGVFPLPVEVVPFAIEFTIKHIEGLGCKASVRQKEGTLFFTDNNHYIVDCQFRSIPDPVSLNQLLHLIPGIVETGLFPHSMVSKVVIGHKHGTVAVKSSAPGGNE